MPILKVDRDKFSMARLGYFQKMLLQKLPKYFVTVWAVLKNRPFEAKTALGTFWATLGGKLDYFFQRLVTLATATVEEDEHPIVKHS